MSKQKHKLIVIAHPDDESIFFAGLILMHNKTPIHVACVTDGNADGQKKIRQKKFQKATRLLGVKKIHFFNLPDHYSRRLNLKAIEENLRHLDLPNEVYTHGPIGEYGHPHHQDVAYAVHRYFNKKAPVYSPAYNCVPDKIISLKEENFLKKIKILSNIYFSETDQFINILPASYCEGFCKINLREVTSIYEFFTHAKLKAPKFLEKYKCFRPYFLSLRKRIKTRLF